MKRKNLSVYVVFWSRTQYGKPNLVNAYRSEREAVMEVRHRIKYDGGWFHLVKYKPNRKFVTLVQK
jgi:hypothetical protein